MFVGNSIVGFAKFYCEIGFLFSCPLPPDPPVDILFKHCTLHRAHGTLNTRQCTQKTLPSTLHTSHYTLYCKLLTALCILHTSNYIPHCTLHALHTAHCKLHTEHCTLHTKLCQRNNANQARTTHSRFRGSVNCVAPSMENRFQVTIFCLKSKRLLVFFVWSKMA